jgi:hypothetical protein
VRVNVYAEEITGRVEIVRGEAGRTGIRFFLELPVTMADGTQVRGSFAHRPGDDDTSAVTFWDVNDLRPMLRNAIAALDAHYAKSCVAPAVRP